MTLEETKLKRKLSSLGEGDYREIFVEVSSLYEIKDIEGKIFQRRVDSYGSSARLINDGKEYIFSRASLFPDEVQEATTFPQHDYFFLLKIQRDIRKNLNRGEITLRSVKKQVFIYNDEGMKQKEEGYLSVKLKDNGVTLRRISSGKTPSWQYLTNEFLSWLEDKKKAKPLPKSGEMFFLLEGAAASVFAHEVFWHPLELDCILEGKSVFSLNNIGEKIFPDSLSLYTEGGWIDDEGNDIGEAILVERGILRGFPTTRLAAMIAGLPQIPHGRRESFSQPPLVRPFYTVIKPGKESYLDLIVKIKKGAYITEISGAEIDFKNNLAIFEVSRAYMVLNGRVKYPLSPFFMMVALPIQDGDIFIGAEEYKEEGLFCHKNGQVVRYSSNNPNFLVRGYGKPL